MKPPKKIRIAAIADIHTTVNSQGIYTSLFKDISKHADVLVLCGDLTEHGLPEEANVLREELEACTIPKVGVLGNHDFETYQQDDVKKILRDAGLIMLEDEIFKLHHVGFTGVKGFGGGYGKYMLTSFGEESIKQFVSEAVHEVERLEIGLQTLLHMEKKVVALHYSPITGTNVGEPLEIYPFLGNSRLEEVIDRYNVSVVFHGHAHYGNSFGKTKMGIDVHNVSLPLLRRNNLHKPYTIITL